MYSILKTVLDSRELCSSFAIANRRAWKQIIDVIRIQEFPEEIWSSLKTKNCPKMQICISHKFTLTNIAYQQTGDAFVSLTKSECTSLISPEDISDETILVFADSIRQKKITSSATEKEIQEFIDFLKN